MTYRSGAVRLFSPHALPCKTPFRGHACERGRSVDRAAEFNPDLIFANDNVTVVVGMLPVSLPN